MQWEQQKVSWSQASDAKCKVSHGQNPQNGAEVAGQKSGLSTVTILSKVPMFKDTLILIIFPHEFKEWEL